MPTVFVCKDYTACSNQRDDSKSISLAITYHFYDDKPEAKRRSTAKRKPSQYSDRNKLAWCMEKYLLEKIFVGEGKPIKQWLRNNELDIHFIWQQFMLSENQPLFVKR